MEDRARRRAGSGCLQLGSASLLPPPMLGEAAGDDAACESDGEGPAEQALASLKAYAHMAWEECRKPLTETVGSAQARWEIYSTWTLLLCLHHAEAESERCSRSWAPKPWETEAQALRHIFLSHRSVRALGAVLRWLRWVHRWTQAPYSGTGDGLVEDMHEAPEACTQATYERTRRAMAVHSAMPAPLQAAPALHPDGPLQQRARFDDADMEEERRLLRSLWIHLRRGEVQGAITLCERGGQSWRASLLQGMMPFAYGEDEQVAYDSVEDGDEDLLAKVKEDHTDWTEIGVPEEAAASHGNPWRRLWKEQCWDVAQRNLRTGSAMDAHELAIYGLCSGHYEALMQGCEGSWADQCWGELHCLKEWLIERLLDTGRPEWCASDDVFLGEGDSGVPDVDMAEDRRAREAKLFGRLKEVPAELLEEAIAQEVRRICARIASSGAEGGAQAFGSRDMALAPFKRLQATLIEAAWVPSRIDVALETLRGWLAGGFDGGPCPFLVKQFAGYFAIWHKDVGAAALAAASSPPGSWPAVLADDLPAPEATPRVRRAAEAMAPDVDDIVRTLVQDLADAAANSWVKQCLEGQALELIVEHVAALSVESRLEAYTLLLLDLGSKARASVEDGEAIEKERQQVLRRSICVYWGRYPREAFALVTVLVRRALRVDAASDARGAEEPEAEAAWPSAWPRPEPGELAVALECVAEFWVVARDMADQGETVAEAISGFSLLFGQPLEGNFGSVNDFLRAVLELVALPLLADAFLSLAAVADAHGESERGSVVRTLFALKESVLWRDAFNSAVPGSAMLRELDWYLGLRELHDNWRAAWRAQHQGGASQPQVQAWALPRTQAALPRSPQSCSAALDALLDCAAARLAQDRPLLEPLPDTHTLLSDAQWRALRQLAASRVLFLLVAVFEDTRDFEGALHNLTVSVAQSPWMLQLAKPAHLRAFLARLARIPALDSRGAHALPAEAVLAIMA